MKIVISSGHGKYVRGASGYIDEVDEARRVVEQVAVYLNGNEEVDVWTYHDDVSTTQNENLNRIVDFHNSKTRDLDVSVHFNANQTTSQPVGCEVLYYSQAELAAEVADEICIASGLKDRGGKKRTDLFFLNNTEEPAILIEVCFVDSKVDVELYQKNFDAICEAIAGVLMEWGDVDDEDNGDESQPSEGLFRAVGRCSYFGGPDDAGVSPSEDLAFIYEVDEAPHLFLPYQPPGTTGLARRLNPYVHYVACRWNYDVTPRDMLKDKVAWVKSTHTGYGMRAFPADWGPNENTGRVADLSPQLLEDLGLETDDEVEVIFPYEE